MNYIYTHTYKTCRHMESTIIKYTCMQEALKYTDKPEVDPVVD